MQKNTNAIRQESEIWNMNKRTQKLITRQHDLKNWLEANFVSGKYFTIEEIVKKVCDSEGYPYYHLNKNPYAHDKCIALSNDVKALNWATNLERYIPIVKNKKGSIKLAENKEELKDFIQELKDKVENAHQYANHLQSLINLQDTLPFINLSNRVLNESEIKPIEVYANE